MRPHRASALALRTGVLLSALFLVAGLADSIVAPEPVGTIDPSGLAGLPHGVATLQTSALIHFGVLLLLLTPIARLVVATGEFLVRRETAFVLMCVGVIFLLILSVFIGSR